MLYQFIKHNKIDIFRQLEEKHHNTTIEKLQKHITRHWSIYNANQYVNICNKQDSEFNIDYFLDSWCIIPQGDFIEQQARKSYLYQMKADQLFNFALYALNNKCLTIEIVDIEIIFYILFVHVEYNLDFNDNTTNLISNILTNKYFIDYQLILCYIFMKLLPSDTIYKLTACFINKLTSEEIIRQIATEPLTYNIFHNFVAMLYIPHQITSIIIKHIFKQSLYNYLMLFTKLTDKTISMLKRFCYKHFEKTNNINYTWYLLARFEEINKQ